MRQPENKSVKQPQDPSRGCPTDVERKRASQRANRRCQEGMVRAKISRRARQSPYKRLSPPLTRADELGLSFVCLKLPLDNLTLKRPSHLPLFVGDLYPGWP